MLTPTCFVTLRGFHGPAETAPRIITQKAETVDISLRFSAQEKQR